MNEAFQASHPDPALNERLDLTFALQAAGLGVWELDPVTNLINWDDRCRELFGLAKDNRLPYEQALHHVHPQDVSRVDEGVRWAMNPESGGHYDVTYRTIGADDGKLRWVRFTGRSYFTENGQIYRFAGVAQDVTEDKRKDEALRQVERRFQSAFDNASMGIVITALDGQLQLINKAFSRMTGYSQEELYQSSYQKLTHPDDLPYNQMLIQQLKDGLIPYFNLDKRYIRKDGSVFWVRFNVTRFTNEKGEIDSLIGICQDITQELQARQALEDSEARYRTLSQELENRVQERTLELETSNKDLKRSNDNLQQFAYVASHDLQEPLRKIQSFGTLLNQQYGDRLGNEGKALLQRINVAGARMSNLIKDLLAYSRISTRQQIFGSVPLDAIITGVLTTLEWDIIQRDAHIEVEEMPVVRGDESQLGQLFQNLIANALKFTPLGEAPRIRVRCFKRQAGELPTEIRPTSDASRFYQISVSDHGVGFDIKYLDRIFQVFQRLHSKNEFPGTGVGLAICQRVAENHGGAITADSQPGQGATFCVYLPI